MFIILKGNSLSGGACVWVGKQGSGLCKLTLKWICCGYKVSYFYCGIWLEEENPIHISGELLVTVLPLFILPIWKIYMTRGDLCKVNLVRSDYVWLSKCHYTFAHMVTLWKVVAFGTLPLAAHWPQRTEVWWLQAPWAAPPLQQKSTGIGGRPGRGCCFLAEELLQFLLLLSGRNRGGM